LSTILLCHHMQSNIEDGWKVFSEISYTIKGTKGWIMIYKTQKHRATRAPVKTARW
jgi:hypothetical protein